MAATMPAIKPMPVRAVAQAALVRCHVVIKMPDGSRGEHEGLYPHSVDAVDRALELFPQASVVCVTVARGRRAAQ